MEHVGDDTCHDDINMVMSQHQRLPRVIHFLVISWTSKNVPRGSPYSHVENRMVTWRLTWKDDVVAKVEDYMLTWKVTL